VTRRLPLLALALGLLTTSLASRPVSAVDDCGECASYCNTIPMDPTECRDLYCPACASAGTVIAVHPVG
jgi:hypothetical protein